MSNKNNKQTAVIAGAGQMGRASAELLSSNNVKLLAFADNSESAWGREISGAAVMPTSKAIALDPDIVVISVLGEDRAKDIHGQIRELGYEGKILELRELYNLFDIRSRCIHSLAKRLKMLGVRGAAAELGVYRGDTAWQINDLFADRKLYLFDTFEGFDERDLVSESTAGDKSARYDKKNHKDFSNTNSEKAHREFSDTNSERAHREFSDTNSERVHRDFSNTNSERVHREFSNTNSERVHKDFSDTSVDIVMERMPHPENCIIKKGYFPETAESLEDETFAFVSLDPDLYAPVLSGLEFFYPRLSKGGVIVVHDYDNKQFEGVRRAVDEFENKMSGSGEEPLCLVPLGDLHGSCVITKK